MVPASDMKPSSSASGLPFSGNKPRQHGEWAVWAQAGSEGAQPAGTGGSSRQCPPAPLPTRFPRHQCEEETQAVASSDSRQGPRRLPSSPSDSRPPAAPPPLGASCIICAMGRGGFTPQSSHKDSTVAILFKAHPNALGELGQWS